LLYAVGVFIVIPLSAGVLLRTSLIRSKGRKWFEQDLLPRFAPVTIAALLTTLVFIFAFQADSIVSKFRHVILIAVPIIVQVYFNSSLVPSNGNSMIRGSGRCGSQLSRQQKRMREGQRAKNHKVRSLRKSLKSIRNDGANAASPTLTDLVTIREGSGLSKVFRNFQTPGRRLNSCKMTGISAEVSWSQALSS